MLNPLFFLPMVLTAVVNVGIGYLAYNLGVFNALNPTVSLPWIMPAFLAPIFNVGIIGCVSAVVVIVVDALIYLPFFIKADKLAYAEECESVEEESIENEVSIELETA